MHDGTAPMPSDSLPCGPLGQSQPVTRPWSGGSLPLLAIGGMLTLTILGTTVSYLNQNVRLNMPENPRFHGAIGTVVAVNPFIPGTGEGEYLTVATVAGAFGQVRAHSFECDVLTDAPVLTESEVGLSTCDKCGSDKWIRTGVCLTCANCGESNGGCS